MLFLEAVRYQGKVIPYSIMFKNKLILSDKQVNLYITFKHLLVLVCEAFIQCNSILISQWVCECMKDLNFKCYSSSLVQMEM